MKAFAVVVTLGCAHNVAYDAHTGEDGKPTGAVAVPLVANRARARGIVTYPGGDRIDWRTIELPAKQSGTLEFKLTWRTPRPRLQLAFDVFDQWFTKVATTPTTKSSRVRTATVQDARGKYFVRIYAVGRGDAGRYTLDVALRGNDGTEPEWTAVKVPPPPSLPDLPTVVNNVPCDLGAKFDPDLPDCYDKCPRINRAKFTDHPGCKNVCTVTPKDPSIPACAKEMTCNPSAPNRQIPDCARYFKPCADPLNPDPANPNCDNTPIPPIRLRHTQAVLEGNEVRIRVLVNTSKIDKTWSAELLDGDSDKPLRNGRLTIVQVDSTYIELRVSSRQVSITDAQRNHFIRFSRPGSPVRGP